MVTYAHDGGHSVSTQLSKVTVDDTKVQPVKEEIGTLRTNPKRVGKAQHARNTQQIGHQQNVSHNSSRVCDTVGIVKESVNTADGEQLLVGMTYRGDSALTGFSMDNLPT